MNKAIGVGEDGKRYCVTHSPKGVARRARLAQDRYERTTKMFHARRDAHAESQRRLRNYDALVLALQQVRTAPNGFEALKVATEALESADEPLKINGVRKPCLTTSNAVPSSPTPTGSK
jgi:hypothetical protein